MRRPPNHLEEHRAILNRLRSAEGHLHGVIGMLEAGQPCDQVLNQLEAVEAALKASGRVLRSWEFRCSAEIIVHSLDEETRVAEVGRLVALCRLPIRYGLPGELTETESNEQTSRNRS